jgi:hypothetical protein
MSSAVDILYKATEGMFRYPIWPLSRGYMRRRITDAVKYDVQIG